MEQKILPVFQIFIAIILMELMVKFIPYFRFDFSFKFIVFGLLTIISILLAFISIYSFRKHKTTFNPIKPETTSVIVNSGIYAYSRNPMYLAMLIFLIAVSVLYENVLAFLPIPLFIWFITQYQIKPEEKILLEKFKGDYQHYLLTVRRWV
ncbi:isoprenylcysteine carboxylmethyltransferase family protein [Colwellia sp. UCD-KL20]|uniref:methyltransferase family protein n=1 Tax=Colwellia sp. UCD-KL20 TaxID=1917165 RepID=UPI0009708292|nr:isoprenylcysteine carboxylmethyltransferase family protein [Colwellia sp. UCD-KL20]